MVNYSMRMAANKKSLEIFIYDNIGRTWFSDGITADGFAKDLKAAGKVDTINLRINSAGGDVADGLAIYNTLKRNEAKKIVDIDGVALSIASIIAIAGDEVHMASNAMFMIHDPWGMAMGNSTDLRKRADVMDQFKEGLVNTYAAKTGKPAKEIANLMTDETWYTASEAFESGFVDSVTEEIAISNSFDLARYGFRNIPQTFMSARAKPGATPNLDTYRVRMAQMEKKLRTSFPAGQR